MRKDRIVLKDRLERTEQVVPLSSTRERIKIGVLFLSYTLNNNAIRADQQNHLRAFYASS